MEKPSGAEETRDEYQSSKPRLEMILGSYVEDGGGAATPYSRVGYWRSTTGEREVVRKSVCGVRLASGKG